LRVLKIETGNTRSHCVENSLWKRLWTCRNTDCGMKEGRKEGRKEGKKEKERKID
jgi:hypothetical protein